MTGRQIIGQILLASPGIAAVGWLAYAAWKDATARRPLLIGVAIGTGIFVCMAGGCYLRFVP